MTEARSYSRGDVLLVSAPLISDPATSKVRPTLVVQNNIGNRFSSNLVLVAISSQLPRREYPTNVILKLGSQMAEGSGLHRDSVVQSETVITVPKTFVRQWIGRLGVEAMKEVDDSLRVSLNL
ncbi:MAG: type toxin-antitoxin system PemK/MazF family toxin [Chloroflexi bacterium]|nr:type toxin-antitoxin system PemK/MazF family toxin [Chloroflexota bacterium]